MQSSIKVDAGTGTPVEFQTTAGSFNRQTVTIGDPTTDANLVAVDGSGNLQVKETTLEAAAVAQGTTASTKVIVVAGKSNDGTPQYKELPLGPSARSLIVEGVSGGTALKVDASATTQPVSGTVTANAGTNLNTSALALESGGNLATVAGAYVAQGTALGSTKNELIAGSVTTNAPTYTTGQISPLSLDTSGNARVSLKDSPSNTNNFNVAVASALPAGTNTIGSAKITDGTNTAAVGTGTTKALLSSIHDGTNLAGVNSSNALKTDITTVGGNAIATAASGIQKLGLTDGSGNAITSTTSALDVNIKTSGASNISTNIAQMNGVAVTMGNGTSGTGVQRVTLASDSTGQVALAAGTALVGQISASSETSTVYNGTTALTPSFATISTSSSGASSLVSLVASKHIRVLALSLVANGAVNVKFQSHTTPTDLTGLYYLAANGGFVLPYNPVGWFQSNSGEQLDINLSGSVAVGGSITYVAV